MLSIMHDVLEPAYKRGVSPSLRIENAIEQLRDNENIAVSYASHELGLWVFYCLSVYVSYLVLFCSRLFLCSLHGLV